MSAVLPVQCSVTHQDTEGDSCLSSDFAHSTVYHEDLRNITSKTAARGLHVLEGARADNAKLIINVRALTRSAPGVAAYLRRPAFTRSRPARIVTAKILSKPAGKMMVQVQAERESGPPSPTPWSRHPRYFVVAALLLAASYFTYERSTSSPSSVTAAAGFGHVQALNDAQTHSRYVREEKYRYGEIMLCRMLYYTDLSP